MSYGADTDYFDFADTYTHLQGSGSTPERSEASAEDSNGDVDTFSEHDTTSTRTSRYSVCGAGNIKPIYDTATGQDFRMGKVIKGTVITGIAFGTDNKNRPTVEISGQSTSLSDSDVIGKYDPGVTIARTRKAQAIGVTLDTGVNVISSSVRASVNVAKQLDSDGEEACLDVYGGQVEAVNNLVAATASEPGATVAAGWVMTSGVGRDEGNTEYGTGSVTVKKVLARGS